MSDTYQKIWCSRYIVADCNLEVFIIIKTLKWSFWTLEINIEILRIIYIYIHRIKSNTVKQLHFL